MYAVRTVTTVILSCNCERVRCVPSSKCLSSAASLFIEILLIPRIRVANTGHTWIQVGYVKSQHTDDKSPLMGTWSGLRDPLLPCDAMLAQYMLSLCVRPSDCPFVRPFVTSQHCTRITYYNNYVLHRF